MLVVDIVCMYVCMYVYSYLSYALGGKRKDVYMY